MMPRRIEHFDESTTHRDLFLGCHHRFPDGMRMHVEAHAAGCDRDYVESAADFDELSG